MAFLLRDRDQGLHPRVQLRMRHVRLAASALVERGGALARVVLDRETTPRAARQSKAKRFGGTAHLAPRRPEANDHRHDVGRDFTALTQDGRESAIVG